MAKFIFTAAYPQYYPTTGLFAEPRKTYELDAAPDDNWCPADETATAPVETTPAPVATPTPTEPAADPVAAAEALLEANPALAAEIVEKAAKNAG